MTTARVENKMILSERPLPDEAALWKALDETMGLFGDAFRNAIIYDLNCMNRDNPSRGPRHLEVGMISESLKRHFSLDARELIMNRVMERAYSLESRKRKKRGYFSAQDSAMKVRITGSRKTRKRLQVQKK